MQQKRQLIGELLIEAKLISREQLEQGLHSQVVFGGRIGTNLVDLECISLNDLGHQLAQQLGIPEALPESFAEADQNLVNWLPLELCATYKVFPLYLQDRLLHLAMVAPQNLQQLDELTFALGLKIQPYIAPELRMLFFLEQRLGIPREKRFLRIRGEGEVADPRRHYLEATVNMCFAPLDFDEDSSSEEELALNFTPEMAPKSAPAFQQRAHLDSVESELVFLDDVPRPTLNKDKEDDFEVVVQEAEPDEGMQEFAVDMSSLPTVPVGKDLPDVASAPPPDEGESLMSLAELSRALEGVTSRDEVTRLLVQKIIPQTSLNVLFLIRGEMIVGLTAGGTSLSVEEIQKLVMPCSASHLFQQAITTREVVQGLANTDPFQQVIAGFMRVSTPEEVCIVPIVVGTRVINLLCSQTPAGCKFLEDAPKILAELGEKAAKAYVRLIRDLKKK